MVDKWNKCIELAFISIKNTANQGEIQNKKQQLRSHIDEYIIGPSLIRNKIAHGQWHTALNSKNIAINLETTGKIADLDFVQIDILFEVYEKIGQVVEDLIESPHKTHFRDFYYHLSELEVLIGKTKDWNIDTKKQVLKDKFSKQKLDKHKSSLS